MDQMDVMQSFRHADQTAHPCMVMGIPTMAQAQAGRCRQRPHFSSRCNAATSGNNDDIFHVDLDAQHFTPEEISVKMVDDEVVIEGKYNEKQFGKRSVDRHFIHRYKVPEGVKFEDIVSSLSSDGILTVSAPKARTKKETNESVNPVAPASLPEENPAIGEQSSSKSDEDVKE